MLKKLVNKLAAWLNPIKLPEPQPLSIDTRKELENFRYVEEQTETIAKMLKCQPDEILTKINKIVAHIEAMKIEKQELEAKAQKSDESTN